MFQVDIRRIASIDPHYSGRRIEIAFEYLEEFFASKDSFFEFLENLDPEIMEAFLYSIHFYYNHDIFRMCTKVPKEKPLDIFAIIITFAIIENLLQNVEGSKKRIQKFFTDNLKNQEKKEFELKDSDNAERDSIDVLYDARNDFIHRAQRFYFHNTGGAAEINQIRKIGSMPYLGVIKLSRKNYLKLFWKAFLRFFNHAI